MVCGVLLRKRNDARCSVNSADDVPGEMTKNSSYAEHWDTNETAGHRLIVGLMKSCLIKMFRDKIQNCNSGFINIYEVQASWLT